MKRRLDAELVRRGLAPSRARAVEAITCGQVLVSGLPARAAGRRVGADEPIVLTGRPPRYVSRGGDKLAAALDAFRISVAGRVALDAGASTGGFTDCLLQRGAALVHAVDVGRGQLAWKLRRDERVVVHERTNIRHLTAEMLDEPVGIVTADLSFISLRVVAPALARVARPDADLVLLVKPQFEAGPERVGKGGVVRDPQVHAEVLVGVADALAGAGLMVVAACPSPLLGPAGNREFFVHATRHGPPMETTRLAAVAQPPAGHDAAGRVAP